jgi:5-methylcytosine-specific restriction endonuclease McrA
MLKSCKYCGRIHEEKMECRQKKEAQEKRWNARKKTGAAVFRKSSAWTAKSRQVRQRDCYMCLCCKENMVGTDRQYNSRELSVHHITPIEEDYSMRLEEENLITVCAVHHEMCEAGEISRDMQRQLVLASMCAGDGSVPGDVVL